VDRAGPGPPGTKKRDLRARPIPGHNGGQDNSLSRERDQVTPAEQDFAVVNDASLTVPVSVPPSD
jgi:hypothetical protein